MKQKLFTFFIALVASLSAIYASNTQVDGIWYDFNSRTKSASVTYQGRTSHSYDEYSGSVSIPETVTYNGTTYNVTSIGWYAFYNCSSLTSITIPNSVTSIEYGAFSGCSSLTSVTIPNSVTSIEYVAFSGCSSLTSVTIPNSVTSIGGSAFYGCSSLTYVTIPNSVTSIGDGAFSGCSSLTSVTINSDAIVSETYSSNFNISDMFGPQVTEYIIGDDVKGIGDYAFYCCDSLTSVTIPNSVTSIGNNAFYRCDSLTSVTIPNSVTSIGNYAFYYCSSLTSVTIGNSVTSIGNYAFYNCSSLTSVTIPNSVTSIGNYAFYNCSKLTSVTINSDAIVNKTYSSSSNISDIFGSQVTEYIIGDDVKGIGDYAFRGCSSLASVTIGNSVTSIGDDAFANCSSLTSVTIGNSVTSIGDDAFEYCSNITSVEWNAKNYEDFSNRSSTPFYSALTQITSFIIGDSVQHIPSYLCYAMDNLTSLTIPNSVTSIGDYAFRGCSSLASVTIGESVTSIGNRAFYGCSSLTSVTIPNSVTSIGDYAFRGCSSLASVTIGESVTSIGDYAFSDCSGLTSITCKAATPPTVGQYAFDGVSKSIPVYVPCGCVEAYKAANGWKNFTNIQEALAEYSIEVDVNDNIMGTANVDINSGCGAQISAKPTFGYHLVRWSDGNTDNPRSLILTQDTTLTAEFAQTYSGKCGDNLYWKYDDDARQLTITGFGEMYNYTTSTQPWVIFKRRFVTLSLSDEITKIGEYAFDGCVRIREITLGSKMEELADYSFTNCSSLQDIYCYAQRPPYEDKFLFVDNHYAITVHVPCDYLNEYQMDYIWQNFPIYECISSNHVETDGVVVTPNINDVTITWPTNENADTYTIVIKQGNELFCTLTFNADGQLLNIAFAPGRDGNRPAQYAEQAVNGYRFTVTGLTEATRYAYSVTTKDAANQTIATYSGEFTTKGGITTAVEDILQSTTNTQKLFIDGQLIIIRDGKTYSAMGQEM